MTIKVLFFASLVDLVGADQQTVDLPESATVKDLLDHLEQSNPELKRFQRRFRVAVDQEFVELEHRLESGAETALIPPVSGG